MAYEDYCLKLESLKKYIGQEKTGSAKKLAEKLGVTRRTVFNYLEFLRIQGMKIRYSKEKDTYYFSNQ
ncbi:hypothetical protein FACS189430_02420 [Bacteroidia bacterium]|nr:hypothetical protein FACS189430_02420 [Bacteroidia bacterium]